jgi:hypothetical protein
VRVVVQVRSDVGRRVSLSCGKKRRLQRSVLVVRSTTTAADAVRTFPAASLTATLNV